MAPGDTYIGHRPLCRDHLVQPSQPMASGSPSHVIPWRTREGLQTMKSESGTTSPISNSNYTNLREVAASTPCLVNLPNELLTMIAWDDELLEDDLAAFARTCRSIRAAISHSFYTIIVKRNRIPILHWAVERGYVEITRQVLKAGADPNQYWCSLYPKYILEMDTKFLPDKNEYFSLTSSQQNDRLLQRCQGLAPRIALGKHMSWSSKVPQDEWLHYRLGLVWALQRSDMPVMKEKWLESGHLEKDGHKSRFKWTPLHLAVYHGNIELVKLLLDHGSYPAIGSSGLCPCAAMSVHGDGDDEGSVAEIYDWSAMHLTVCSAHSRTFDTKNFLETLLLSARNSFDSISSETGRQNLKSAIEALAIASILGEKQGFEALLDWTVSAGGFVMDGVENRDNESQGNETEPDESENNEDEGRLPSSSEVLLQSRIAYCAARSHNWPIVEHFARIMGPDHNIKRSLEHVLQESADAVDIEACAWLLDYGVEILDKGRFLRSLCPTPTASMRAQRPTAGHDHMAVIMRALDRFSSADINSYGSKDRNCALGLFMTWVFGSEFPNEAGERIIVAMLDRGGDLHAKDPREGTRSRPKSSDLTPLGCALKAVATNADVRALERLHRFLQLDAASCSASAMPQGEYLHNFFISFGYDTLGRVPEHMLIRMARTLLLLGVNPEERDAHGETALSAFLEYLEDYMPGWISSRCRPQWKDESVYFLACLQKFGARLDSANMEGRTAEQRLISLQHPKVSSRLLRPGSNDCALPYTEKRRQALAEHLRQAVHIVRDDTGVPRMKFRKPQTIFKDLDGDNLTDIILQDKALWLS